MPRIRTGYSFRAATGKIEAVMDRLKACKYSAAPITDRASCFGWVRWAKLAKKAGLKPVFGLELGVTDSLNAKKITLDYWTFIAKDSLVPLHELFELATTQFRYEPLITYDQAQEAKGLFKIVGHRSKLELVKPDPDLFIALAPSCAKGYITKALAGDHQLIACSDNKYTLPEDKTMYEIIVGRGASVQTYDQHIQTYAEWLENIGDKTSEDACAVAVMNRERVLKSSTAELKKSTLLQPKKPRTLKAMCEEGARLLKCDLTNPVYAARLDKELRLIDEKKFEDYFYIIADLVQWSRDRMIVGPARGSSCGSLVCYLLRITTVDPIPFELIFERFIDINRMDLPDIDIDFSDRQRHLVFEYMTKKYGADRIARLGTVAMYKAPSAIKEAGTALQVPKWKCDTVVESLLKRSSGDARALDSLKDTFETMQAGKELIAAYPEMMLAAKMEGHPRHYSQHAAGIVLTQEPVNRFVAIDRRTGATQCDKKDAEELNLLKIDALGLTQLSVFEYALELAGLDRLALEKIPMDDPAAFKVLNDAKFCGIFQFNGMALQSIVKQIDVSVLNDIISVTALARPGPLASGGAHEWVRRKNGINPVTYPHKIFEPYLKDTLGIVLYQEQVMEIGRNVGDLSWDDVTQLRKSMSKSLGVEYFNQWGDKWKAGAAKKGCDPKLMVKIWDDLCAYGSWCLAGDTRIKISMAGNNLEKNPTIKQLYEKYELNPSPWIKQGKRKPSLVSLFPDGKGWPQKSSEIIYSGKKDCWKFSFKDGSSVTCTKDHRFIINGTWQRIRDAKTGDSFNCLKYDPNYIVKGWLTGEGKGHNKGRKNLKFEEGFSEGKNNPSWKNGISKYKKQFIGLHKKEACLDCSEKTDRMEAHHNDFNSGRNRPKDLAWLCASCHKKRHYENGRKVRWSKGHVQYSKELVSIKHVGMKDTYDISMPEHHNFSLANDIITHNSFNKSHAVAYGIISYQCCWLKAHYPFEFAAATLSYEQDPDKQLLLLREMVKEGYNYTSVDPKLSTDRWTVGLDKGQRILIGPFTNVKSIGPKTIQTILSARARGEELPAKALKLLAQSKTSIDSLFPIGDAFRILLPDPATKNIFTPKTDIIDIQAGGQDREVLVFCVLSKINPRDENKAVNIARRNGKVITGEPTASLNLQLTDDTDTIFGKVSRWDYMRLGKEIVDRGQSGKCLYAIKGLIRGKSSFRMISIKNARFIGLIEDSKK